MAGRKEDTHLIRIILILLALGAAVLVGHSAFRWLKGKVPLGGLSAPKTTQNLEDAHRLIAENRIAEARTILEDIASRVKKPDITPTVLMLLAELDEKEGNTAGALAALERAVREFPTCADRPKIAVSYARLLEKTGQADAAFALYEEVRDTAPPELRAPALCGLGRRAERDGKLLEARTLYQQAVADADWNSDAWNEALDALGKANVALIFSPGETPESRTYTVERGDSLIGIGLKLNTTQGLLMRANGLSETSRLHPGQRLKYTPKDFRIFIERSACRLFLVDNNGIFKRYAVGLGMPGYETTLGSYQIGNKQKDPTWFKPGHGPVPPGHPDNELGTRWMPFEPVREGLPRDLGIHGTQKPETVGKYASRGCARLLMEDVEELYDLVVRATPVEIIEVFDPGLVGHKPAKAPAVSPGSPPPLN